MAVDLRVHMESALACAYIYSYLRYEMNKQMEAMGVPPEMGIENSLRGMKDQDLIELFQKIFN